MDIRKGLAATIAVTTAAVVLALSLLSAGAAMAAGLRIVSPDPGQTVHDNAGTVAVVVTGAAPGARLQPVLDGRAMAQTHPAPAFELLGVPRGVHVLSIRVLDADGQVVGVAGPVRFSVFQASRLF